MSMEQRVRAALESRATQVPNDPMFGPALRQRASVRRRLRWRLTATAIAVTAAIVAVLVAVPAIARRGAAPPASSTVDGWPTRGDLAGDTALLAAAQVAWEAAPVYRAELPHRDVHVLLASNTEWGRYVVITGRNARGHRRLAVLSDDPRDHAPYRKRLRLRSDAEFPDGKMITYVSQRGTGETYRTLVLAVGPPDVTAMRWRGTSDGTWAGLPSTGGVAATIVDSVALDFKVRAYRPHGKRITQTAYGAAFDDFVYRPDKAVLVRGGSTTECHLGECTATVSRTATARAPQDGDLLSPHAESDPAWEDMADQAEQFWLNYAAHQQEVTSWGGGASRSGLLPDGTGVYVRSEQVNGGRVHAYLYVDRPEWPIGRLYDEVFVNTSDPLRAMAALIRTPQGRRLVVIAAPGVTIRYRAGGGPWQPVAIAGFVGEAPVGEEVVPSALQIEVTFGHERKVWPVAAYKPLNRP
jgi:hypothetical protein